MRITPVVLSKAKNPPKGERGALASSRYNIAYDSGDGAADIASILFDTIPLGSGSIHLHIAPQVDQAISVKLYASADGTPDTETEIAFEDEAAAETAAGGLTIATWVNEVVSLTEDTNITAGTFTLTFGSQTTGAIQHNANAAAIQAALEALSSIGAGNVSVTGGILTTNPVLIEFIGALRGTNVGDITADQTGLTGTFVIAVDTPGAPAEKANLIVTYASYPQVMAMRFFRLEITLGGTLTADGSIVVNGALK